MNPARVRSVCKTKYFPNIKRQSSKLTIMQIHEHMQSTLTTALLGATVFVFFPLFSPLLLFCVCCPVFLVCVSLFGWAGLTWFPLNLLTIKHLLVIYIDCILPLLLLKYLVTRSTLCQFVVVSSVVTTRPIKHLTLRF